MDDESLARDGQKFFNPVDAHVGARVRLHRVELGISQEKLGDGLGLTFQQVQKYEKGTNRIGASRLAHICSILDVSVASLFEGAPGQSKLKDNTASYVSDFVEMPDGLALAKAFTQLPRGWLRRSIVHLVELVADHGERRKRKR